jgi:rod shape-determining protein MreD
MRNTAFVIMGFGFLIIQSNTFRLLNMLHSFVDWLCGWMGHHGMNGAVPWLQRFTELFATPNLILPLIVFTGVHEYSIARGAALACVLGYALDLFSSAPVGLFTFISVCVFLLARAAGVRLAAQTMPTQLALAFLFSLVHGVLILVLLAIFKKNSSYQTRELASGLIPYCLSTALAAPIVFRVAERIHQATISVARPGEGLNR